MKIINEKPPEWIMSGCLNQFRVNVEHTFWTYGDAIYNPGGHPIPEDIVKHEEQHSRQQDAYEDDKGLGKDAWWRRYLSDPRFRLEQEAEAYGEQYRYFCSLSKDRNARAKCLRVLAMQLSGPLYQLAVTPTQAKALIQILSGERTLEQVTHLPISAPS